MALLFALFYLYVWLRVDPRLMYFWPDPEFPTFRADLAFLGGFLGYPGGLVEYVSAFLSQFSYHAWAGALIVAAVTGLLCLATGVFIASVAKKRPVVLHLVPAVLVLLLYNRYTYSLDMVVGLLTAMAFACLYARAPLGGAPTRLAAFLTLSAVLYYAAGGAFVLFAALCGIFELRRGRRLLAGVLCLLSAAAIPYAAGTFIFRLRITDAYGRLLPFHQDADPRAGMLMLCLYAFLLAVSLWAALWGASGKDRSAAPEKGRTRLVARLVKWTPRTEPGRALGSLVLLAAAAPVVWLSFDSRLNARLRVDYLARRRMWPQVLRVARALPARHYSFLTSYDVNRALYHTGRLPFEMFGYRQRPGSLLPSGQQTKRYIMSDPSGAMKLSDIFYDLGRTNESAHMAQEAFEYVDCRPWVLQRLALTHLIKGQTGAASIFLEALSKDLVYGKWAREHLDRLERRPPPPPDDEVRRMRSVMPVQDYAGHLSVEQLLLRMLDRDRHDRMAFEYLMAHYLLTRQLEGIAQNISRLDDLDYAGIPRLYEEAILLYAQTTGRTVAIRGRDISQETRQRFQGFFGTLSRHRDDQRKALEAVAKDYRNSYFFYYLFGPVEATE